ncbi:hypothetical protein SUZIE_184050 [Sciurus carolinensis]|uniref:Uncharacterized protein n=1 Tax=Sciurus carolinensis TaxID=30640 RepID=A0AA41T6W7_SCICA|nr:hypothetical protein [Sciurus carolinensis]
MPLETSAVQWEDLVEKQKARVLEQTQHHTSGSRFCIRSMTQTFPYLCSLGSPPRPEAEVNPELGGGSRRGPVSSLLLGRREAAAAAAVPTGGGRAAVCKWVPWPGR